MDCCQYLFIAPNYLGRKWISYFLNVYIILKRYYYKYRILFSYLLHKTAYLHWTITNMSRSAYVAFPTRVTLLLLLFCILLNPTYSTPRCILKYIQIELNDKYNIIVTSFYESILCNKLRATLLSKKTRRT